MSDLLVDTRDRLVELALLGDTSGARALVSRVAHEHSMSDVIEVVFAGAQTEVGERWQNNRCSVVDEHMATSVVRSSLETVLSIARWRGDKRGVVAVACAEGDWHSMAARFQAEKLISHGWSVRFLGASSPAEHVQNYLARNTPSALVITCTSALALSGSARLATSAHAVGVPVLIGGAAVTPFQLAARLGADENPTSVRDINAVLDSWVREAPTTFNAPRIRLDAELTSYDIDHIVGVANSILARRIPLVDGANHTARTLGVLSFILRAVGAAAFVDSPEVLSDLLSWLERVLEPRGMSRDAIDIGVAVLSDVIQMTKGEHGDDMAAFVAMLHS